MAGLKLRGSVWYLTYSSLPTHTPIDAVLTAYVDQVRATQTAKSAQTDLYYLRDLFGPICEALTITSRKVGPKSRKCNPREGQDRRRRAQIITAPWFEAITTTMISKYIHAQMLSRGLKPKTANRYRGSRLVLPESRGPMVGLRQLLARPARHQPEGRTEMGIARFPPHLREPVGHGQHQPAQDQQVDGEQTRIPLFSATTFILNSI
jgi:hypothetical protein